MTIQFASDLHLEFSQNREFLRDNPIKPAGEILLLAGDIVPFAQMKKHDDFFSYLSDNFQATYWIPGNHEYYNFDAAQKSGILNEPVKSNVFLVNNTSVVLNNVKLAFSTLWTKIGSLNQWQIENGMNDFHVIKFKGDRFTTEQYNAFHEESLAYVKNEQHRNNTDKTMVVTHHVPTFLNYPEKYKGDTLNEAFAVELFDLIEAYQPDYWIYGHTHHNTPPFAIGKTRLLTNQLGYVKYGEHKWFNFNDTLEI